MLITTYSQNSKTKLTSVVAGLMLLSVFLIPSYLVQADTPGWTIEIEPVSGSIYGPKATFGQQQNAADDFDYVYDTPMFGSKYQMEAYFEHTDWGRSDRRYAFDIQSIGYHKIWVLTASAESGKPVTLNWDTANLPAGYELNIRKNSNGQIIDMLSQSSFTYTNFQDGSSDTDTVTETITVNEGGVSVNKTVARKTFTITATNPALETRDDDSDGIENSQDLCPTENASGYDQNNDGCIDDTDGDGVKDNVDACPGENAAGYDQNSDGCIDDSDGDGVRDNVDVCPAQDATGFDDDPLDGCIDDQDGDAVPDKLDVCPDQDATGFDDDGDGCIDDTDGDSVPDKSDLCPELSAAGFDADKNGCIDNFSDLIQMLDILVIDGVIDSSFRDTLVIKVENAKRATDKENVCNAVTQLEVLKQLIENQRDHKISSAAANQVIHYTGSIIAYLESKLPFGESCH